MRITLLKIRVAGPGRLECSFSRIGAGARRWFVLVDAFGDELTRAAKAIGVPVARPDVATSLGNGARLLTRPDAVVQALAGWVSIPDVSDAITAGELQLESPNGSRLDPATTAKRWAYLLKQGAS